MRATGRGGSPRSPDNVDGHFRQRAPPLRRLVREVGLACPPRVRCNGRKRPVWVSPSSSSSSLRNPNRIPLSRPRNKLAIAGCVATTSIIVNAWAECLQATARGASEAVCTIWYALSPSGMLSHQPEHDAHSQNARHAERLAVLRAAGRLVQGGGPRAVSRSIIDRDGTNRRDPVCILDNPNTLRTHRTRVTPNIRGRARRRATRAEGGSTRGR